MKVSSCSFARQFFLHSKGIDLLIVLTILEHHKNRIKQYIDFFWLSSFLQHVASENQQNCHIYSLFLFPVGQYAIIWLYHNLFFFTYQLMDILVVTPLFFFFFIGCYEYSHTRLHVDMFSFFLDKQPEVEFVGYIISVCFNFMVNCQCVPKCLYCFTFVYISL